MVPTLLRWITALLFSAILVLAGCRTEIQETQTYVKGGLLYRIGESKPFSGIVTGVEKVSGNPPLDFRIPYVDGVRQGNADYYYPNGKLARQEPYRDGVLNGILSSYYENGRLRFRSHIVNGERGGEHGEIFFSNLR